MTLPRLRVRELLYLVVYAALIGQAFVLGILTPARPPKPPSGHVWVQREYAIPFLVREQQSGRSSWKIVLDGQDITLSRQGMGLSEHDLTRMFMDDEGRIYVAVLKELVE